MYYILFNCKVHIIVQASIYVEDNILVGLLFIV